MNPDFISGTELNNDNSQYTITQLGAGVLSRIEVDSKNGSREEQILLDTF